MNYKLNSMLVRRLSSLYPSSVGDFYQAAGVTNVSWLKYVLNMDFPVNVLLQVCNNLYVPIRLLIIEEETEEFIPDVSDLFPKHGIPGKLVFDGEAFRKSIGLHSPCKMAVEHIASAMNINKRRIYYWTNPQKSTLLTSQLFQFCRITGYDPFCFIDGAKPDEQKCVAGKLIGQNERKEEEKDPLVRQLEEENRKLRSEAAESRRERLELLKQIRQLQESNRRMAAKIAQSNEYDNGCFPRLAADDTVPLYGTAEQSKNNRNT